MVFLIDEADFAVYFLQKVSRIDIGKMLDQRAVIGTGEKKQAFDELFHIVCFRFDGCQAFVEDCRVLFAPAAQEISIPGNDRNRRPQFMRGVADELLLLLIAVFDAVQGLVDADG